MNEWEIGTPFSCLFEYMLVYVKERKERERENEYFQHGRNGTTTLVRDSPYMSHLYFTNH